MSNPSKVAESAYREAHQAVRAVKGRASEHICAIHGDHPARDWALRPFPVGTLAQAAPGEFSDVVEDYVPLCQSAHREADVIVRAVRAGRQPDLNEVDGAVLAWLEREGVL